MNHGAHGRPPPRSRKRHEVKESVQQSIRRGISAAALACAALVVSACSGVQLSDGAGGEGADCERKPEKIIGIDYPLTQLSIFNSLKSFAEERAAERGYELLFTAANGDVQRQAEQVQTWVTQQVPAITTFALETSSMEPIAREARGNCTVVVAYASQLENQDGYVGLSLEQSGRLLGEEALKWAQEQAEPVKALILNNRDLQGGILRDDGLHATFPGDDSNIEIVATLKAGSREEGEEVTRTVLQAHPDLNMVLAFNDDGAIGAYQAFVNAGIAADAPKVFIGGQDGSEEALQLVAQDGIFRSTVALGIRDVGYAMVDVPADILEGKDPGDASLELGLTAITADSPEINAFLDDYAVR